MSLEGSASSSKQNSKQGMQASSGLQGGTLNNKSASASNKFDRQVSQKHGARSEPTLGPGRENGQDAPGSARSMSSSPSASTGSESNFASTKRKKIAAASAKKIRNSYTLVITDDEGYSTTKRHHHHLHLHDPNFDQHLAIHLSHASAIVLPSLTLLPPTELDAHRKKDDDAPLLVTYDEQLDDRDVELTTRQLQLPRVVNVTLPFADEAADTCVALLLALARGVGSKPQRQWPSRSVPVTRRLKNMKVGVLGSAATAIAIARRLQGFRMDIHGVDPNQMHDTPEGALETILASSDAVIVTHTCSSPSSPPVITENHLPLLKPKTCIVVANDTLDDAVSRNFIQMGLANDGKLSGAAIPMLGTDAWLRDHLNTIPVTPGMFRSSRERRREALRLARDVCAAYARSGDTGLRSAANGIGAFIRSRANTASSLASSSRPLMRSTMHDKNDGPPLSYSEINALADGSVVSFRGRCATFDESMRAFVLGFLGDASSVSSMGSSTANRPDAHLVVMRSKSGELGFRSVVAHGNVMQAARGCAYPIFRNGNFGAWERWIAESTAQSSTIVKLRNRRWDVSMDVLVDLVWTPPTPTPLRMFSSSAKV